MESIFQQEPIKDKRANRIYLKTNIRPEYTLNKIIKDFLEEKGYEVIDEIKGTCSLKTTLPKKQTLKINNFTFSNYLKKIIIKCTTKLKI